MLPRCLNKHAGDFDADDQRLLEGLSQQAAAALENARLFEKVERQQRLEGEPCCSKSSVRSSLEIRLGPLLDKILTAATQLLESERGALFLHDPKRNELYSHAAGGIDSSEIRFPRQRRHCGRMLHLGQGDQYSGGLQGRALQSGDRPAHRLSNQQHPVHAHRAKGARAIGVMEILNRKAWRVQQRATSGGCTRFAPKRRYRFRNAQLFEESAPGAQLQRIHFCAA